MARDGRSGTGMGTCAGFSTHTLCRPASRRRTNSATSAAACVRISKVGGSHGTARAPKCPCTVIGSRSLRTRQATMHDCDRLRRRQAFILELVDQRTRRQRGKVADVGGGDDNVGRAQVINKREARQRHFGGIEEGIVGKDAGRGGWKHVLCDVVVEGGGRPRQRRGNSGIVRVAVEAVLVLHR